MWIPKKKSNKARLRNSAFKPNASSHPRAHTHSLTSEQTTQPRARYTHSLTSEQTTQPRARYFYDHIRGLARDLGADLSTLGHPEEWIAILDGQGDGYAVSTHDELRFIGTLAETTGVVLDPVYSGKAMFNFVKLAKSRPDV
jgi:hypothetical protein